MAHQVLNDRYRLEGQIGEGGMAVVFKAYDLRLGVYRAIKLLHPDKAVHPRLRTRFESEAKTMAKLRHKNIVTIHDIVGFQQSAFMVMELLPGGSLNDRIEQLGPLQPQQAVKACIDVLNGLIVAHDNGVVHRDIKPHNILISEDGVLKITDFGIARVQDEDHKTRTGAIMGTIAYMAPEQRISATRATTKSDLYAVAATLYVLLTSGNPSDVFQPSRQDLMFVGLARPLQLFLRQGCHIDPDQRFTSAREMLSALHDLANQLPRDAAEVTPLFSPELLSSSTSDEAVTTFEVNESIFSSVPSGAETIDLDTFEGDDRVSHEDQIPAQVISDDTIQPLNDVSPQKPIRHRKQFTQPDIEPHPPRSKTPFILGFIALLGLSGVFLWYIDGGEPEEISSIGSSRDSKEKEKVERPLPEVKWIDVKAGVFRMGGVDRFAGPGEKVHFVEISKDFQIMQKEVSVDEWNSIFNDERPVDKTCGGECPIVNVSWLEAVQFSNAFSKKMGLEPCYEIDGNTVSWPQGPECKGVRLPTESEWEFAARGSDLKEQKEIYAGSDNADEVSWYVKNSKNTIHPPCRKLPNNDGICDLSGNVGEWVWDTYGDYPSGRVKDPLGGSESNKRIVRGGSYKDRHGYLRVASRQQFLEQTEVSPSVGIRLVRRK